MYTYNLNPVLLRFSFFEIRWYGVAYVLGFLFVYYFLNKRKDNFELSRDDVDKYMFYLILGTVVGARLFHVLFADFSFYSNNLIEVFKFWNGGMAFHGGLFGSLLTSYYFCKKHSISFYKLGDLIAVPAALGLALGRVANFINGELWGKVTSVSWCVVYDGLCRHPTQIYEALGRFVIFGVLFFSFKKFRKGTVFWMFVLLMGVNRAVISFWRTDTFNFAHYFSFLMIIVSLYFLIKNRR